MSDALRIVEAVREDVRTLIDLYTAAGLDRRGPHDERVALAAFDRLRAEVPTARIYIARDGTRAVGTYTFFILPLIAHAGAPEAIVEDVAVHPDTQGQGVGRAMMTHAMALAREAGCYKLALSSNLKRESAHAFYDSLGFERHGYSFLVDLA